MKKEGIYKFGEHLITIFIYAVFWVLPFYLENHHYNVGEAKSHFLYGVSIIVVIFTLIWGVSLFILHRNDFDKSKVKRSLGEISITEKFLNLYTVCLVVSYVCSEYKEETLWGIYNWRFGFLPLLLISVMTILIIHLWRGNRWIAAAIGSVSALVFLLGVCNRFSIYPIAIEPMQVEYISTLGNINWFCGYLSVIAPIGIGVFVFCEYTDREEHWKKIYWGMYVVLCFVTAFCQGSDSVYLWYVSLFSVLFWIVADKKEWLQNWLILIIMWALSAQLVRLIKFILPPGYFNYEAHKYFISSNFTLVVALIAVGIYVFLFYKKFSQWEMTNRIGRNLRLFLVISIIGSILGWLGISAYNTIVGIPGLEENTLFLLNEKWGTNRGVIMQITIHAWWDMPPFQKLFGCGPDGFYHYVYSIPETETYLRKVFDDAVWTNAHCELLTGLINIGLIGTLSFVGIFVTFVYRCMKKAKGQPLLYIPVVCVACYFIHNLVSFAQVINYPYVFFIMGMGECYLRRKK